MKIIVIKRDALFSSLALTFIALILIIENIVTKGKSNIEFVCTIWGTVSIYAACRDISSGVNKMSNGAKLDINILKGLIEIVFAFLLLLNPIGHVLFHLIVLGIEFILEALDLAIHCIKYRKPKYIKLDKKAYDSLIKIREYISDNPTKEEEILSKIKTTLDIK